MGETNFIYNPKFAKGTKVRIKDKAFLESFRQNWKFHHALQPEQLDFDCKVSEVKKVSFYHGGDELYILEGIPGIWHDECLELASK